MPETHAKLSPSSAERWMQCPGSVPLSEGMPERTSEAAEEGTRAHKMAEAILLTGREEKGSVLDLEMEKHVRIYTEYVENLYKDLTDGAKWIEHKIAVTDQLWGTADALVWDETNRVLHVIDLKYGSGKLVEVRGNMQLRIYALAALLTMKLKAKTVVATIVQPRAFHEDGAIRSIDFDALDLMEFHGELMDGIREVEGAVGNVSNPCFPNYLRPSANACRWCLAAPKCPKVKTLATESAKKVFAVATTNEAPVYDPKELSSILDKLDLIEGWCKNVREFAYNEVEAGREVPGWKLVDKKAVRKFKAEVAQDPKPLAKALGVTTVELFAPAPLLGISEIEALAPGKNKKEREEVLAPFVTKESGGHALVHESDKRPAVKVDAKSVFAEVLQPSGSEA